MMGAIKNCVLATLQWFSGYSKPQRNVDFRKILKKRNRWQWFMTLIVIVSIYPVFRLFSASVGDFLRIIFCGMYGFSVVVITAFSLNDGINWAVFTDDFDLLMDFDKKEFRRLLKLAIAPSILMAFGIICL